MVLEIKEEMTNPDEARSAKRAMTTAQGCRNGDSERKRKDQALDVPPGLEIAASAASASAGEPASYQASEGKRRRGAARIEEAVEGAMETGDLGMIMAVLEAIESDEGEQDEQDEPDEIWYGKEWLDPRRVKEGGLDESRRLKHFDVYEVVDEREATGQVLEAKWVDWQKGSVVRSRIVARQFATKSLEHLFAGTPDV